MDDITKREIELSNKIDAMFDAASKRIDDLLASLSK